MSSNRPNNVVPLRAAPGLAAALVDGIEKEAAHQAVRRACNVAIVAAFDLGQPLYAISKLRDAIAVINTLALDEPPAS